MKKNIENIKDYWEKYSCGEELYLKDLTKESFDNYIKKRYRLEPYIIDFAEFSSSKDQNVLEIGVGIGADHLQFAKNDCSLHGIDLTERAIKLCRINMQLHNLDSNLSVGNSDSLQYENDYFDKVYSWGVIHHSPNTKKCVSEIYRVLRVGGTAKIMVYNYYSIVGFMLWVRFALFRLKLSMSLKEIYDEYLESPGTKAFTKRQAENLFSEFNQIQINSHLTHADLLLSDVGQRYKKDLFLKFAKFIWPRFLIKVFMKNYGLFLLIEAKK